ncbi:DUF5132 domain-containing protein [Streptomyces olivaceus]|uniref:DUF5132 domain-containing protein n=1 Tax=Streptomyces olivaceus TaxID=47716 RepID=UPI001CCDB810|nr:DUF5132 domain-containing protein [Streptomyces olivaceus]MBZ6080572.1 DUF5132 domain-containing protein [Streptomyces olivaceus]
MPPVVPPFLIGLVAVPLAKRFLKPLVRGVITTSVGVVMDVKKAAHEAGENLNDLAAEVAADVMATQLASAESPLPAETGSEIRSPKIRATTSAAKGQ